MIAVVGAVPVVVRRGGHGGPPLRWVGREGGEARFGPSPPMPDGIGWRFERAVKTQKIGHGRGTGTGTWVAEESILYSIFFRVAFKGFEYDSIREFPTLKPCGILAG